ncbi:MAG: hypothetical protein ABFD50_21700 [Smithella sp.]
MAKKSAKKKIKIVETKLGRQQSLGLWQKVNKNTTVITIDERLKGFQRLMIVTHEALHEVCPDWTEEKVQEVSEFLASVLWRCDYRHVDHKGEAKPSYKPPVKSKKKNNERSKKEKTDLREPGTDTKVD